jgi:ABC-type nitrate/sulfonate/bicarbonate transport system permease component
MNPHRMLFALNAAIRSMVLSAVGITGFLTIWYLASNALNPVLLPQPASVLDAYRELVADGSLAKDTSASLIRVFGGFAIAASIAPPLALLLASSWTLRCIFLPIVTLIRPIPPIAWIPLAILWFGLGDPPSYFITALAAFFPIFLNSFAGGQSLETEHVNAAQSGLGFMIQASRLNLETSRVLVGMTLIGILGASMTAALSVIERKLIVPWNYAK